MSYPPLPTIVTVRSQQYCDSASISFDEVCPLLRELIRIRPEVRNAHDLAVIAQLKEAETWLRSAIGGRELDPTSGVLALAHDPNDPQMPIARETLDVEPDVVGRTADPLSRLGPLVYDVIGK
jgi:hypothetical protein